MIRQNSEHAEAAREQHREPLSPPRRNLTTPSPPTLPKGELALRALEKKMAKEKSASRFGLRNYDTHSPELRDDLAATPHLGAGAGSESSGAPTGILHLDTT